MRFTKITLFHVIWIMTVPLCTYFSASLGLRIAWFFAVVFGIFGLLLSHAAWCYLVSLTNRSVCKHIENMSTDDLWAYVRREDWDFSKTMALLQLAARKENVRTELPRILSMLESESELQRVYGWDTFMLVYPSDMVALAEGYEPRESAGECRRKLATLRDELSPTA